MIFMSTPDYFNVNEEYLQAHRFYRSGDYEDCIVNCNKAFESTIKVICNKKGYTYEQNATTPKLVSILFDNNFIPSMLQQNVTGLRKTLGEGISVIGNNKGGHGKGAVLIPVNDNLASFTLNITGAAIKLLLGLLVGK